MTVPITELDNAAAALTTQPVHVALIQLAYASSDIRETLAHMRKMIAQAISESEHSGQRAQMIVLPEPDVIKFNAEPIPAIGSPKSEWNEQSVTCKALASVAQEFGVWLVGGTIIEQGGDKLYNTATVWSSEGELKETYRKAHLFDLCLPKMTFKESDTFGHGQRLSTFDTPFGKFGLAICYDIRFPEIAMIAARKGCIAMLYPAAFNRVTGPLHWELLQRSRALDNQIYVATCAPAQDEAAHYVSYAHSMASSPLGEVIARSEIDETIVHFTIDPTVIRDTRAGIPLSSQRRFDLYADVSTVKP